MEEYCRTRSAAEHIDSSPRTIRKYFKQGLKHVKLPSGRYLTKFSWIDEFLELTTRKRNRQKRFIGRTYCRVMGSLKIKKPA